MMRKEASIWWCSGSPARDDALVRAVPSVSRMTASAATPANGTPGASPNGAGPVRPVGLPRGLEVLLGAAAIVVVFIGVQAIAWLIGPAFLALIIVIAVAPVQRWLWSKGCPRWASTLIVVLAVFVSIARLGTELPKYAGQGNALVDSVTAQLAKLGVGPEQIKQAASSLDKQACRGHRRPAGQRSWAGDQLCVPDRAVAVP